jgi:hypothetical protein
MPVKRHDGHRSMSRQQAQKRPRHPQMPYAWQTPLPLGCLNPDPQASCSAPLSAQMSCCLRSSCQVSAPARSGVGVQSCSQEKVTRSPLEKRDGYFEDLRHLTHQLRLPALQFPTGKLVQVETVAIRSPWTVRLNGPSPAQSVVQDKPLFPPNGTWRYTR